MESAISSKRRIDVESVGKQQQAGRVQDGFDRSRRDHLPPLGPAGELVETEGSKKRLRNTADISVWLFTPNKRPGRIGRRPEL